MSTEWPEVLDECECRRFSEIEEGYAGALQREELYGCGTDTLCAAGDENRFISEAWVGGEGWRRAHSVLAEERGKLVAGAEEEDGSDDEAIGCGE